MTELRRIEALGYKVPVRLSMIMQKKYRPDEIIPRLRISMFRRNT